MINIYKKFFIVLLLFLGMQDGLAVDTVLVDARKSEDYYLRGSYLEIFEDKSGVLTIAEVSSPLFKDSFLVHKDFNSFAYIQNTSSAYWIRFVVKGVPPVNKAFILENLDLHIENFEFYKKDSGKKGKFVKEYAGFRVPFDVRKYPHKNFVFDLALDSNASEYYVRAKSNNHNPFLFKVKSTSNFSYYAFNEYYLLGMFYGILAIMAIYNFLVFLSLREKVYIYYVIYVVCCAVVSFGEDGTGFQYLWPSSPSVNTYISMFSPLLLMISFSIYSKSFLEMKKNVPLMDKILNGMIIAYIGFFILDNLIIHLNWDFPLYIVPFLVIYIASILCLKKGFRPARYYIVGYSFMFVSIIFLIFRMSGVIHWDDIFTVYSFNIGLVFEIVILSFALGDRIKIMKEENETSQKKIIEQLKENEKLKDKVNRELEEKVKERTLELKEKNDELEKAYEEIHRMNQLLESDNKVLKTNVKELSKARVLMKEVDFSEFSQIFPDRESCLKYLEDLKWRKGYKCKKCSNAKWCNGKDDFSKRCTKCRYDESPTAYTIFHKLKFPITKAFYMLFLVYANKEKITSLELSQILQLRQSTCWNFNKKINEALKKKKKQMDSEVDGWGALVLDPEGGED